MHARARKRQTRAHLLISLRLHVVGSYVRVRARIIMKIKILVDRFTESLSLKFYKDPLNTKIFAKPGIYMFQNIPILVHF